MDKIAILNGPSIPNPGDGKYRIQSSRSSGFSSITVDTAVPGTALSGTIDLILGTNACTLDLSSDSYMALSGRVPYLDIEIKGVDAQAAFSLVLL